MDNADKKYTVNIHTSAPESNHPMYEHAKVIVRGLHEEFGDTASINDVFDHIETNLKNAGIKDAHKYVMDVFGVVGSMGFLDMDDKS